MKKRFFLFQFLLAVVLSIAFLATSMPTQAAAGNKITKKWVHAYIKLIDQIDKEYPYYEYELVYINKDNIPELAANGTGNCSLYTYDNKTGKVYTLMEGWGYGLGSSAYVYIPRKNLISQNRTSYAGKIESVEYWKIKKHKIVNRNAKELKIVHFDDKNRNQIPDEGEGHLDNPLYYYGSKKISKKKFFSYALPGKEKSLIGGISSETMKKRLINKV